VATAGQAEVGAADPQPAVVGRRREHLVEEGVVGGLEGGALGEGELGIGDAKGEGVANFLQLTEPEDARRPGGTDPVRDVDPPEARGDQPAQLAVELADLPAQLGAGAKLVGVDSVRSEPSAFCHPLGYKRQPVDLSPVEQIRHDLILSRLEGRGNDPECLFDGDRRDGADADRGDREAAALALDPAARPGRPEEESDRAALVGDRQRPGRQLARPAGERLAGRRVADAEVADEPVGVEGAQRHPGLDRGDRQRVGGQAAAAEAPVLQAVENELLDRGAVAIGVEADLAVEDSVGPGDRSAAQADRLGAEEAIGEVAEAAADRLGATAGAPVDLDRRQREPRELSPQMWSHPARRRRRLPTDPDPWPFDPRHRQPLSATRVAFRSSRT
jgi:hypothetical protein